MDISTDASRRRRGRLFRGRGAAPPRMPHSRGRRESRRQQTVVAFAASFERTAPAVRRRESYRPPRRSKACLETHRSPVATATAARYHARHRRDRAALQLEAGGVAAALALRDSSDANAFPAPVADALHDAPKTYLEVRTWLHVVYAFQRVYEAHALWFQARARVARGTALGDCGRGGDWSRHHAEGLPNGARTSRFRLFESPDAPPQALATFGFARFLVWDFPYAFQIFSTLAITLNVSALLSAGLEAALAAPAADDVARGALATRLFGRFAALAYQAMSSPRGTKPRRRAGFLTECPYAASNMRRYLSWALDAADALPNSEVRAMAGGDGAEFWYRRPSGILRVAPLALLAP